MSSTTTTTNYHIQENGTFKVVTTSTPISLTPVISEFAETHGYLSPEIEKGSYFYFLGELAPVFMHIIQDTVPFTASFTPLLNDPEENEHGEPVFVPSFLANVNSTPVPITGFKWRPWPNMKLVYVRWGHDAYIILIGSDGTLYRPPLPNLYENCNLCNGEALATIPPDTLILDQCRAHLDMWANSPWNADLREHIASPQLFLHFLESTHENIIHDNHNWEELCSTVSLESHLNLALSSLYGQTL